MMTDGKLWHSAVAAGSIMEVKYGEWNSGKKKEGMSENADSPVASGSQFLVAGCYQATEQYFANFT